MNKIEIGKVVGTHGLKGEIKFEPWCNDLTDFFNIKRLFDYDGNWYEFEKIKPYGKIALLNLTEIDTIEKAEFLKGKILLALREELPKLPDGKYYLQDLLNFDGYLDSGEFIGKLVEFIEPAGRLVYIFSGGVDTSGKEVLVPNVPEFIKEIDFDNKKIIIKNVKGLI